MNNYRVTVGVESTNDYDKAKQDVRQAWASVSKLPSQQQRRLAEEFVGEANVAALRRPKRSVDQRTVNPSQRNIAGSIPAPSTNFLVQILLYIQGQPTFFYKFLYRIKSKYTKKKHVKPTLAV